MHPDVVFMYDFYQTVSGGLAKRVILETLDDFWQDLSPHLVCGLGYSDAYFDIYHQRGIRCLSLQSVYSGIYARQPHNDYGAVMIDDNHLPLSDNSQERILCVHLLEHAASPHHFISEISRILSPTGEAIIIVPNRRGLWARFEQTPFGCGKPYTKRQLKDALEACNLHITQQTSALFFPPKEYGSLRLYVNVMEYIGRNFLSYCGGVHIIKVIKRSYIPPQMVSEHRHVLRIFSNRLSPAMRGEL